MRTVDGPTLPIQTDPKYQPLTLRQRFDQVGLPLSRRMGGPLPSSIKWIPLSPSENTPRVKGSSYPSHEGRAGGGLACYQWHPFDADNFPRAETSLK